MLMQSFKIQSKLRLTFNIKNDPGQLGIGVKHRNLKKSKRILMPMMPFINDKNRWIEVRLLVHNVRIWTLKILANIIFWCYG